MRTAIFPGVSPIFVVGAPRSGTTLLARILDSHPRLAIADELIYFDILLEARSVVPELDTPERIERFFELLPRMDHVRYWRGVDEVLAEVKRRLLDDPTPSYPLLYLLLMQVYAERQGAARFGEKTPWNVRHLDEIVALFPDARIVHMVRDPRAQVASRRKLPRSSRDVVSHALKWRLDLAAAGQFARGPRATEENYMELRYEDLVTDPEQMVRNLCSFIGETFDEGMLAFHRQQDVMFRDQPWKEGVLRPLHPESLHAWRDELTSSQAHIVELICGPWMRRHRYAADGGGSLRAAAARLPAETIEWLRFRRRDAARRRAEPEIQFAHGSAPLFRLFFDLLRGRRRRGG